VVEDEIIIAADIRNMLVKEGYDVVATIHSGDEAVEKLPGLRPDLVLMDIILGGNIDGIEASLAIRSTIDVPIVTAPSRRGSTATSLNPSTATRLSRP